MNAQQIRDAIDARRREQKLTQAALGQLAALTREEVSRFLGGKDIPLRRLLRLCAVLGLTVEIRPATSRPTADELSVLYTDDD